MDWSVFIIYLGACAAAAATGSLFPPGKWYDTLEKPGWTPPNWLFPIAWTVLYVASAVAAARIAAVTGNAHAMAFWALQIALNTLWSPIFFGLKRVDIALIALGALWAGVFGTLVTFMPLDAVAGWLIVPYLVWVSYAGALNYWIWRRNPQASRPVPAE